MTTAASYLIPNPVFNPVLPNSTYLLWVWSCFEWYQSWKAIWHLWTYITGSEKRSTEEDKACWLRYLLEEEFSVQSLGTWRQAFTLPLQKGCVLWKNLILDRSPPCFAPVPDPSVHLLSVVQPVLKQVVPSTEKPRHAAKASSFQRLRAMDTVDRGWYIGLISREVFKNIILFKTEVLLVSPRIS